MTDPLTTSIATAVATGATAALSDGVRTLITRLATFVRERFQSGSPEQDVLTAATNDPRDPAVVRRLADLLDHRMRDDPEFARQLRALWTEITAARAGQGSEVTNVISGEVHGPVIQARDVAGGITFHEPGRAQ